MKYSIYYPTPLNEIKDIKNDNIDVCVNTEFESYTFVIATIDNLKETAWYDKRGFVSPCAPILLVESLTKETIECLIEELSKDEVLFKLYGKDLNN